MLRDPHGYGGNMYDDESALMGIISGDVAENERGKGSARRNNSLPFLLLPAIIDDR